MHFENKTIKIKFFTNLIILMMIENVLFLFSKFAVKLLRMNFYSVAVFYVKENYLMDAIELMKKLVLKTRQEEGCLQYNLAEGIHEKGVFFISELWETQEHHFRHSQSEYLADFRIQSTPLLDKKGLVYSGFRTF